MLLPSERPWVVAMDGAQIVAVQHGCGVGGAPVNCYIDEYRNWVCGRCAEIYGAAVPLEAWKDIPPTPQEQQP